MKCSSIRYLNAISSKSHYHHIGDILMKVFVVGKDAFYFLFVFHLICFRDVLVKFVGLSGLSFLFPNVTLSSNFFVNSQVVTKLCKT